MAITVTQLAAFLAVVRSGSVTAAAEELEVTQPSVSSAVAALAKELGCELLERSGRGIQPTPAGREFAAYAGDALGLLEAGRRAARETAERATRELRVAASSTAAETFVPGLLQRYGVPHSEVEPRLTVAAPQAVLDAVLEHRADLAIVGHAIDDDRLNAVALGPNELVCVVSAADRLGRSGSLRAQALEDRVWLLREQGSTTRHVSEQFLTGRRLAPDTLTLGSNAAIKQAVSAGLGVALLARAVVEGDLAAGTLVEIPLSDGPRPQQWQLVYPASGPVRPAVLEFLEFSRERQVAHA